MSAGAFEDYFGLTATQARILNYLYRCSKKTSPRTCTAIATAAGAKPGSVKVYLSQVRDAMEAEAIDTIPSTKGQSAYLLTEVGVEECLKAVSEYQKARAT